MPAEAPYGPTPLPFAYYVFLSCTTVPATKGRPDAALNLIVFVSLPFQDVQPLVKEVMASTFYEWLLEGFKGWREKGVIVLDDKTVVEESKSIGSLPVVEYGAKGRIRNLSFPAGNIKRILDVATRMNAVRLML